MFLPYLILLEFSERVCQSMWKWAHDKCQCVDKADSGVTLSALCCCFCGTLPCFPGSATVNLENGDSVTMYELQLGDKVQTGMDSEICNFSILHTVKHLSNQAKYNIYYFKGLRLCIWFGWYCIFSNYNSQLILND